MFRNGKKILIILLLVVAGFIVANFTMAATLDTGLSYAEGTGLGQEDPRLVVANVIRIALGFLGVIAVGLIMYAGWLYMSANGEEEKVEKARKVLTSAIIGLVIILSAFGIASFILSRILEATGGSSSDDEPDPGFDPSDPYPDSFYLRSTVPVDGSSDVVRNTRVRFNFNKSIDDLSVDNASFTVSDNSGDVLGVTTVNGKVIEFIPDGTCPENSCGASNCFGESTSITVTLNNGSSGVLSTGGLEVDCTLGQPCTITFTTGTAVDCESPTANLYFNSGQVCVDFENEIFASALDDSGISNVEFFEGSTSIEDVVNPAGENPFNTSVFWDGSGQTVGASKTFSIDVYDLAYNTVNDSETINLRATHCCNGIIDNDESDIDCGGSDCAACAGSACATDTAIPATCSNTLCASNFCSSSGSNATSCALAGYESGVDSCCLCSNSPRIDALSPLGGFCDGSINTACNHNSDCLEYSPATCNVDNPNGKEGNFVTISGRYFGSSGEVYFTGESGWILASLPNTVNSNCTDNWRDDEIIVVVPSGATDGPIKVVNTDGLEDSTNDSNGANIRDFLINSITRPGICKLDPSEGVMDDTLIYYGINFESNNIVYFGDYNSSSILGVNTSFVDSTTINSNVPNIETGEITSYVLNGSNVISNYIDFEKKEEPYSGPSIISFEPVEGNIGQYITVKGSGFGSSQRASHVYFDFDNDITASYEFPDVCSDSFWSDSQIIIKVPAGLSDGYYTITMVVGSDTVDTSGLTPSKFFVDTASVLLPSLCKIEPIMGLNNGEISLWGEYFDSFDANSKVRFYLNHDQSGESIGSWELDNSASGIEPYKIITTIHQDAVSGGVSVVAGSPESVGNSLNLEIGLCSSDTDCGSQICCPSSSAEEGRCMDTINDCYASVVSSVYEWDFSTGSTQEPISTTGDSCISLSWSSGSCDPVGCPNSPGQCSLGEVIFNNSCGDDYCAVTYISQCGSDCVFDDDTSKCVADSGDLAVTCSAYEGDTFSVGGTEVELPDGYSSAECKLLGSEYYWQINPNLLSCPDANWELNIGGWCTLVDSSTSSSDPIECDICDSGFDCETEGGQDNVGKCYIGGQVCSDGVSCVDGTCNTPSVDQCECCCRIANEDQDCCATLTCAGDCGNDSIAVDAGDPDPEIYGLCSGCRIEVDGVVDQVASDLACNCSTSSGKYCDADVDVDNDGTLDGVCRDCNQLPTTGSCSVHYSTCCSDALDSNVCKGGEGYQGLESAPDLTTYYCGYYRCEDNLADGCYGDSPDYTMIADVGNYYGDVYSAVSECEDQCQEGGEPGMSCFDEIQETCTLTCNSDYECIGENGCGATGSCAEGDTTCLCCCDPGDPDADRDPDVNTYGLECREDIAPCDGPDRGLYCGCSEDEQCGTINTVGCGSDTCCRARPSIQEIIPTDGDTDVCRNALIYATFDQKMDINSFTGNMIVVGDYGEDACPSGTEYIAKGPVKKRNVIARIVSNISSKFRRLVSFLSKDSKEAIAYETPNSDYHYCAMPGTVEGEDIGSDSTKIKFSLTSAMESNKKYYVIIKGDEDLDGSSGVLNDWDIGYNGPDTGLLATFNGIEYKNSKIWQFTTGEDICLIDSVEIDPYSYLFQEVGYEKDFTSSVESDDGQAIVSIDGVYSWREDWTIDNESVVKFLDGTALEDSNIQTIVSQNKEDARTYINVKATIIEDEVNTTSTVDEETTGRATAYVFLCQNPWPAVDNSDDTWEPWEDTGDNCIEITGTCNDTNYQLYYCRDNGSQSTVDDLPAFNSDTGDVIVRGSSLSYICTDPTAECTTYGDECGDGGTCEYDNDLLKETYFFGEAIPLGTDTDEIISLVVANETTGGKVKLQWCPTSYLNTENPTYLTGIENYNIYYSTNSDIASNSSSATQLSNVFTTLTSLESTPAGLVGCYNNGYEYTVDGLTNGENYYFVVSAVDDNFVESDFSNEVDAIPSDTEAPSIVEITDVLTGEAKNTATVKWTLIPEVSKYKISYVAGNCTEDITFASEIVIDSSSSSFTSGEYKMSSSGGVTITDGFSYCLAMQVADSAGNYSDYSELIDFYPFSVDIAVGSPLAPSVYPGDNEVDLTWDKNSGAKGYKIILIPETDPVTTPDEPSFPEPYITENYPNILSSLICSSGSCAYNIINGNTDSQEQIVDLGEGVGESRGVANGVEARYYIQAYQDCYIEGESGTCYSPLSNPSEAIYPLEVISELLADSRDSYNVELSWEENDNDVIDSVVWYVYYKGGERTEYPADSSFDFMEVTGDHALTITMPSVASTYDIIVKTAYCRWGTCYYSGSSNEVEVIVPGS